LQAVAFPTSIERVPSLPRWTLIPALLSFAACTPRQSAPPASAGQPAAASPAAASPASVAPPEKSFPKVAPILGLKRCINLGNALDAPKEGEWGVVLQENHFKLAKSGGFDHVRLPVRFSAHAAAAAPYTIDETFFKRVDWAIAQALGQGLAVILDVHHYNELMEDPDAHVERLLGFWKQIAERYQKQPEGLIFEIVNEPNKKLDVPKLNALYQRAIPLIRATNPTRIIMTDSYFWANTEQLHALELPADANVVAHFHMYQPILFTHQGAPWMDPEFGTLGVVFPGPPEKPLQPLPAAQKVDWVRSWFNGYNSVTAERNPSGPSTLRIEFDRASQYAATTGRRVYLGEFGAVDKADMASRVRFVAAVREEAEKRGIAWCYWDDGGGFQVMKPKENAWVEPLKRALIP
jgi:endoglucanase